MSSYAAFISVQDEVTKAYKELGTTHASEKFKKPLATLSEKEFKEVQKAYPSIVSETTAEYANNNQSNVSV